MLRVVIRGKGNKMAAHIRSTSPAAASISRLSLAKSIRDSVFMFLTFLIGFAGLFAPRED